MILSNNWMKLVVQSDNEMFVVEAICRTDKEANDFCALHPNCGVIATDERGNIIVANIKPRHSVKVTFANGHTIKTEINGTVEEVRRYYINQMFNIGTGGNDNMQKCTRIDFID